MVDLNNLFQNKMFLQFLSAAGQDVSAGRPPGQALGGAVQQNIASQNFSKLMAGILKGNVPEGGSMKVDSKGFSLNLPKETLNMEDFDPLGRNATPQPQPQPGAGTPTTPGLSLAQQGSSLPASGTTRAGSGIDWTDPNEIAKLQVFNPFL